MELREARSLVLLAQLKSIKRIAEAIHISPPSVHKHLKTIGLELGVPAYERDGRALKLTEAAKAILPYLQQMVAEHDTAARVLGEWKGVRRGLVRIGAGPIVATYLVPTMLAEFLASYPGVNLLVQTGQVKALVEKLIAGDIDLAFLVIPELREEPHVSLDSFGVVCGVVDLPMVLVSGKPVPRRNTSIGDLANVPFVLYEKGSAIDRVMDRYFHDFGFRPRVIVRCDHTETIKAVVQKGLGMSLLPCWAVEKEVRNGTLWRVKQRERPLFLNVVLAARKRTYGAPAVRAFIEIVKSLNSRHPDKKPAAGG
ncbi:MAG: LysR family transcriptional regulator [Acidobacteria bacterium]|nr:LysR family transcriptional regulator [Acidobacteriota bacterium]MCL5744965.1 LysR family transcriptional regulator [Acidobacteriota bacterium]